MTVLDPIHVDAGTDGSAPDVAGVRKRSADRATIRALKELISGQIVVA
jgi:hypothetical protein